MRRLYMALFSSVLSFFVVFTYLVRFTPFVYGYDLESLYNYAVVSAVRIQNPDYAGSVLDEAFKYFQGSRDVYIFHRYIYDTRR